MIVCTLMPLQLYWVGFERMLLINDLFFNSSVVAQRVSKLGAPRAQHLGLNCICKVYEGVHHGEGNTLPQKIQLHNGDSFGS